MKDSGVQKGTGLDLTVGEQLAAIAVPVVMRPVEAGWAKAQCPQFREKRAARVRMAATSFMLWEVERRGPQGGGKSRDDTEAE
jgi:hypothetical protein